MGRILESGRTAALLWGTVLVVFLSGCESARFYGQAISGQTDLMVRRQSIDRLLKDSTTPADLREDLQLTREILTFADENLGLPSGRSYSHFVALDRPYVTWNVAVCPEFDLEPVAWWYPVVGRLEHRGYFRRATAERFAERKRSQGLDVQTGGVLAYSTLGWFSDPVLSTFLESAEWELAELLFHELAHQRYFLKGDTDFNEAYAVVVAEVGVRRWYESKGDQASLAKYERELKSRDAFARRIQTLRDQLEVLYHGVDSSRREKKGVAVVALRKEKQKVISSFQSRYRDAAEKDPSLRPFLPWVEGSINNATLGVLDTYYYLVPAFRRLFDRGATLEHFYAEVAALGKLPPEEREAVLNSLQESHLATALVR